MKKQSKKAQRYVDTVTTDFWRAVVVVSLSANLIIFVTWVTYMVAAT